jgi:hypothetical protein
MFGMLDYRAHKLWVLLFYPLFFGLRLFAIYALPFIAYVVAVQLASDRWAQAGLTIALAFLIGVPWQIIVWFATWFSNKLFAFLVDVVPANGRTKQEAQAVVYNGAAAIAALELTRPPAQWSAETIEYVSKVDLFNRLFSGRIRDRLHALQSFYADGDVVPSGHASDRFLREQDMYPGLFEKVVTNVTFRGWAISYIFLIALLLWDPLGR